jgi:phage shock protein PspC (stress-responsive transcriptional regulator)
MNVVIALISIVTIGVLAYVALDCLIPKDPPEGGQPSDC